MAHPDLINDDLLDLLGKLYRELKLGSLLHITFTEFVGDYERHLADASLRYISSESTREARRCAEARQAARELADLDPVRVKS